MTLKLAIVPTNLPDPPYPADTKTRGWRLETDYERLEQGDTWALAGPEIRPWLLMTYFVAWKQVPSGSLPADDELIAAKIGLDLRHFRAYRDILMRGFWLANDGRFYHSVLTEQVLGMLQCRKNGAGRTKKSRANNQERSDDVTRYQRVSNMSVTTPEPEPEPEPKSLKSKTTTLSGKPDVAPSLPKVENPEAWDFTQEPANAHKGHYLLAFLNRVTDSRYQAVPANLKLAQARAQEYTLKQLRFMITAMQEKWGEDPKMRDYLRPKTLFSAVNCAQYIEMARKDFEHG